ncbi:hypothetical protein [uncultured Tenacibaculum sp.]|uniref:hypothetical protein n=1 Tax=uncultured Tenacibaculum sp. TaxID=174713 RepID=UPI00261EA2A8|nr:hypothetical protein [uncultured Tenacibaculum sp.]
MKTSIDILKSWFQTGDKPTENQFENLIDSFHHKDEGNIITSYQVFDNGNVSFTLSDGNTTLIEKFILPNTMPQNFIDGLVETLNSKVDKITGKQLSDENFSLALKQKLETLENYIHPEFHQITEVDGLQEVIESKVDKIEGKQLSDENFSSEEKEKLAGLENYIAPDSKPISYIEELEDTITKINQDLDSKVDIIEGKQLSDENFSLEEKEKLASFNINTFASISDGTNRIIADGQADELIFEGAKIDVDKNTIIIENNSSGLNKITEETNTGWRLAGQNPIHYGNIGLNAVDLSQNNKFENDLTGATGSVSFAANLRTTANSQASSAFGRDTQALANESFAAGASTTSHSHAEFSIGQFNTEYTPKSKISFNAEDRVFNIGNGATSSAKSDALTVYKNGAITAPSLSYNLIENYGKQSLVTKEYADINYGGKKVYQENINLEFFNTIDDKEVKYFNLFENITPNTLIIPTNITILGHVEPFTEYGYSLKLGFADLTQKKAYIDTFHNIHLANLNGYTMNAPYVESNNLNMRFSNLKDYGPNFVHGVNLIGEPNKRIDSLSGYLTIKLEYTTMFVESRQVTEKTTATNIL